MTPFATSYTISKELTGYSVDQTINPSELNLWRVLQINSDGTIDMISEYTSSNRIYFQGDTSYKNYIGVLNMIASAYTNSTYTIGSRYPGYNGQTEFLTVDLDKSKIGNHNSSWNDPNEPYGGGDMWFTVDVNLIKNVLQTLYAYSINLESQSKTYYIAGRYYWCSSENSCGFYARYINTSGNANNGHGLGGTSFGCDYIRPIVTLKANLTPVSGDGSEGSPWTFKTE